MKKLVGEPFCRGPNSFKTFIGEICLIEENFVGTKFSLGKIFVRLQIFCHFSPTKNFSSHKMNMFDLS